MRSRKLLGFIRTMAWLAMEISGTVFMIMVPLPVMPSGARKLTRPPTLVVAATS